MSTKSWKRSVSLVFVSAAIAVACGSSEKKKPTADAGPEAGPAAVCGNGKKEGSEKCDKTDFGSATCSSILMSGSATGSLSCSADCKTIDSSKCVAGGGTGGGGTGGSGTGGSGMKDGGGPDASDASSGGGGSGGTGNVDAGDSGKG